MFLTSIILQPRNGYEMVYDSYSKQVLLFGGFNEEKQLFRDLWRYRLDRWEFIQDNGPPPRKWSAMTYDLKRNCIILFGGRSKFEYYKKWRNSKSEVTYHSHNYAKGEVSLADIWIWTKKQWIELLNVDGPSPRDHHRMIYDPFHDQILLFGGWDGEKVLGDTWIWDYSHWTKYIGQGPSPRAAFSLIYDPISQNIILFGGKSKSEYFNDTWIWNGKRWKELKIQGPAPRAFAGFAYNSKERYALLYGGHSEDREYHDTWIFENGHWYYLENGGPNTRGVYKMVYLERYNAIMFFGSNKLQSQKWQLSDDIWWWHNDAWHPGN